MLRLPSEADGTEAAAHVSASVIFQSTNTELLIIRVAVEKVFKGNNITRLMTIHEAQGLTCDSVIIINTKSRRLQIHDSVSHAVVVASRHTNSCVYYSDDAEDAIGRFAKKAMDAPTKTVVDYNLKTAMQHRDASVIEPLLKLAESLVKRQTT